MRYDLPIPDSEFEEERDLKEGTGYWALDNLHSVPAFSPLGAWIWVNPIGRGTMRGGRCCIYTYVNG